MTNKHSFTFILTPLLLAVWFSGSALNAHAEWELILDNHGHSIASDGERLYVSSSEVTYFSRDDGDTWRESTYKDWIGNLAAFPGVVFGYNETDGIMRSVTKGNTWQSKNNGFDLVWDGRKFYYPEIHQFLVTASDMVVAVGGYYGTWVSGDFGDSWHAVTHEWTAPQSPGYSDLRLGTAIQLMSEFDGYLWAVYEHFVVARSTDDGATWESIPNYGHRDIDGFGRVGALVEFRGDLYVGGTGGFGRWREETLDWDNLSHGLPAEHPDLSSLVVHRDRLFAGSWEHGVFVFDHHAETWHPAGLSMNIPTHGLVSHRGNLYAVGTTHGHKGVYRAKRPFVSPEGKTAVNWGALKTK